jgi:pyruvate formate lyase activating enzyme
MTVDEVMAELEKDAVFYKHGGGITLSGGEPLFQSSFAAALLTACRERGFHSAIETSLYAPPETVDAIVPLTDTIFADCKIMDDGRHRDAAGASNQLILENLRRLLKSSHAPKVVVRTPLVPDFTAAEENIAAIAAFISGLYPDIQYELLNYNPLAAGKYILTGRDYCFTKNPKPFTQDEMEKFRSIVKTKGIRRSIVS